MTNGRDLTESDLKQRAIAVINERKSFNIGMSLINEIKPIQPVDYGLSGIGILRFSGQEISPNVAVAGRLATTKGGEAMRSPIPVIVKYCEERIEVVSNTISATLLVSEEYDNIKLG